jgi:hypothetical protein
MLLFYSFLLLTLTISTRSWTRTAHVKRKLLPPFQNKSYVLENTWA